MITSTAANRRKYWITAGLLLTALVLLGSALVVAVTAIKADLDGYSDQDFVVDLQAGDLSVGTALRLPRAGIFGKARYYVVVVRDPNNQLVKTLYEGPGAYPDVPLRPSFVSASDGHVTYQIPATGMVTTFEILGY